MAQIALNLGNGSAESLDLDLITATNKNILTGKTASDNEGEVLAGGMAIKGNITQNVNCDTTIAVNEGKYDNSTITVNSLASQTDGTATANKVLNGYKGYSDGTLITGNVSIKSASNFKIVSTSSNSCVISWTNPSSGPF